MKKIKIIITVNLVILSLFLAGCIQSTPNNGAPDDNEPDDNEPVQRTIKLYPNAAGNEKGLTAYGTASNYDCINEENANDNLDYVYMPNLDVRRDLYNLPDINYLSSAAVINSVTVTIRVNTKGSQSNYEGEYYITIYNQGAYKDYTIGSYKPGDGWVIKEKVFTSNPLTNNAWTVDDVNNMQIGIKIVLRAGGGGDNKYCCTQEFATIDCTDIETGPD